MNASAKSSKSSNFRKSVRGSLIHAKVRNIDPRIKGDFEYLKLAEFVIFIWISNGTLYLDFPSKQGFTCQTEFHIIQTCAHKGGRHQYIPILILVTPPDMSECWLAGCKRLMMTKNALNSGQSQRSSIHTCIGFKVINNLFSVHIFTPTFPPGCTSRCSKHCTWKQYFMEEHYLFTMLTVKRR